MRFVYFLNFETGQLCEKGFHQDNTGQSRCEKCFPGRYSSEQKSEVCAECPKGWMQKDVQGTSCTLVEAGSIVGKGGASSIEVAKGWHTTECDTNGMCANSAPCEPGTIGTSFQTKIKT